MDTNILALPFKATKPLPDLAHSLVQHVSDSFNTTHPDAIRQDAEGIAKLRLELFGKEEGRPVEVHEVALRRMVGYYAQLSFAITKLPLDVGVSFPWYPIFASSVSSTLSLGGFPSAIAISLSNLQYERLSVLYNIAAMYSAIGAQGRRSDADGIKASIAAFQNAAGTLAHLLTLLPLLQPEPSGPDPPSPDLTRKSIKALRDVCLAQAQEAFWQKAVMDGLKNGTIAKLAAKVSEYYADAAASASDAKGANGAWPLFSFLPGLLNHLTIKKLHFAAAAQFRKAVDDLGANRYGDELGRLKIAEELAKRAADGPRKGVAESVIRDLKSIQSAISTNRVRSTKDNDLIYLEHITPASSLSPIVPASMVKPTSPPEVVSPLAYLHNRAGGLGKPYFETLVPYEVYLAVKVYEDRKEGILAEEIVGRKNELDAAAASSLRSQNLPASIEAILQPIGPPPSLMHKAEEVRSEGGPTRLKTMMQDVRRVAQVNQKVLSEALDILQQEEAEDDQHRAQYGTDRWTRQPSRLANAQLQARAENLAGILESAGKSDGLVRAKFGEWEDQIQVLGSDERSLAEAIPVLATPTLMGGATSLQSSTLRDLRRALDELEDLQSIRSRTVEDAKHAFSNDDVRPAIMSEAVSLSSKGEGTAKLQVAEFEDVFERQLGKFKRFRTAIGESAGRQADLLARIKTANEAFVRARRDDPQLKAREQALQDLDTAYHKYREISVNLQEGLKFYSDMAKLLGELRDGCKQWAYQRRVDGRDQVDALAHALDGVRMSVASPGAYDPARDGPIRFG